MSKAPMSGPVHGHASKATSVTKNKPPHGTKHLVLNTTMLRKGFGCVEQSDWYYAIAATCAASKFSRMLHIRNYTAVSTGRMEKDTVDDTCPAPRVCGNEVKPLLWLNEWIPQMLKG
jgi:hypothetical protein